MNDLQDNVNKAMDVVSKSIEKTKADSQRR